ncbi:MAG: hypothetical protein GXP62_07395, partial [Oligoflexia bacterium]|nr:hypothetical protein [Oligoflexia bacterium]
DPEDVGKDFALRRFSMRPVTVSGGDALSTATVSLSVEGEGVALWSEAGDPLTATTTEPLLVDPADLPLTLLVQGLQDGATATLSASVEGCGADPASVDLRVAPWTDLAGRSLGGFPWLERVDAFSYDEQPQVGLDPALHGDRVGLSVSVYVVQHQIAAAWAEDPTLEDAGDGAEDVTISGSSLAANTWTVWATDLTVPSGQVAEGYDVIIDMDGDGLLSPGDVFEGPGDDQPAFWAISDLTALGPHDVTMTQYSGGVWLGQRTYYPSDIADLVATEGPRPLVILSHGNGHDYRWYDYLGYHLASWGYVFMAHQNNTGPGIETASDTTLVNTDWIVGHMAEIDGGALKGNVDTSRIAWIGHSRGGEGVTRAYDKIVDGVYTPENFDQNDIVLISSIAPTVFLGVDDSNPHDRWYHLIAGSADGDVTGGPSSGVVQYLRIAEASAATLSVDYVHGAAHNDFNCCGFSDGTGPDLIGRVAAQEFAKATYLALLQWVVLGEPATADLVRRSFESFHSGGIPDDVVVASQFRPDPGGERLVLDDFQTEGDIATSSAGTAVVATVDNLVEGRLDDDNLSFAWDESDPMNGMTLAADRDDLSRGAVFDWAKGDAIWRVDLPAGSQDVTGWTWLSLRACQGTRHPYTDATDAPLTFAVTLVDAGGAESTILLDDVGQSLTRPYPRAGAGAGSGWANEWNTVRLRVSDFVTDGADLDLTHVMAVELRFGDPWGSAQGRIGLDDVLFSVE